MWNRLNGVNLKNVAGSIRSTVSDFASEVAKQAQSLTEEEEEEDEHSPRSYEVNDAGFNPSARAGPSGSAQSTGQEGIPFGQQPRRPPSSSTDQAATDPVSSRITALKAKLEADRARKRAAVQRPDLDAEPTEAHRSPGSATNNAGGSALPSTGPISPSASDLTPPDSLATSPALTPEPQNRHSKGLSQNNPLFVQSQEASKEGSPGGRQHPQQAAKATNGAPRGDGFVDIPLHSPDAALPARAPNGVGVRPAGAMQPAVDKKDASDSTAIVQLRDQLQRLKAEMVSSARAQEEEQSRLQEELAAHAAEVSRLQHELEAERKTHADQQEAALLAAQAESRQALAAVERDWEERLRQREAEFQQLKEESLKEKNSKGEELETRGSRVAELQQEMRRLQGGVQERLALQAQVARLEEELSTAHALGHSLQSELHSLRAGLHSDQDSVKQEVTVLSTRLAEQELRCAALEGELATERDAHENTLRDAEAAMLELDEVKSKAVGLNQALEELSSQVEAERAARLRAEASASEATGNSVAAQTAEQAAASLAEREATWAAEVRQIHGQLGDSQHQVQLLGTQLQQQQQEAAILQDKLQSLESRDLSASASLQAAEDKTRSLEREAAALEAQLSASMLALREADGAREELQQQVGELEAVAASSLEQSRAQEQHWQEEATRQHRAAAQAAAEREARLEEQLRASNAALAAAQQELEALRRQLATHEASRQTGDAAWQQEVSEREAAYSSLQAQLEEAVHERDQAAAMLSNTQQSVADIGGQVQGLQQELTAAQQHSADLQQKLEATGLERSAEVAAVREAAQEKLDDLQRQLLSAQATCGQLQAELDGRQGPPQSHDEGQVQGSVDSLLPAGEAAAVKLALLAAEAERDRAKQQLSRLKQQMVVEQDEEDDKLRWRVDAEVAAAVSQVRAAAEARQQAAEAREAKLRSTLAAAEEQAQRLRSELSAWEAAVAERDAELRNLQGALGELTYESEAAERLRAEIRVERSKAQDLKRELARAQDAQREAEAARAAAEAGIAAQRQGLQAALEREKRLSEEASMLRRAVQESMKRINLLNSDSGAMVDRRIVVKLLVTFFQRGQSPEILDLMARMLGLSDDDKAAIRGSKKGVLRSIVQGTVSLARTTSTGSATSEQGRESLADSWVEFLIQQAQAADAADMPAAHMEKQTPATGQ